MKSFEPVPQPDRQSSGDLSPDRELQRGLAEVARLLRNQRLAAALLPFATLGASATLLGWLMGWFPALAAGSWIAMAAGWLAGCLFFLLPGLRRIGPERAARLLDCQADQQDRFRSAWHFLSSGRDNPLETLTVEKAGQRIQTLSLGPLFPLKISRAVLPLLLSSFSIMAYAGWAAREGRDLTPDSTQSASRGQQVASELRQAISGPTDPEVEELLQQIESEDSLEEILALVEEMREKLGPTGLDEAVLAADLENLTAALDQTNPLASALASGNFEDLADALGQLPAGSQAAQDLEEFLEDLPPADSMAQPQTRDLLKNLQDARKALGQGDRQEAARKLDSAARDLREMAQDKRSQEQNRAAARAIEGLQQRMQQEGQTPLEGSPENAGGASLSSSGSASTSEAPAEESADGQMAGSEGTASSPGPEGASQDGERTPLQAEFEVEFGQARSMVREPSGRKTRDLPSIQVEAARVPSDGRIRVRQELEQALNRLEVPLDLRERIRNYFLAINDGKRYSSGN